MSGVDTKQERDLLDFRPDISRLINDAILADTFNDIGGAHLDRETLSKQEQQDKDIQEYLKKLEELDNLFTAVQKKLTEQQRELKLSIDAKKEPIVSEALLYLTNGKQSNIISYDTWKLAQDILENGYFRSLGGNPLQMTNLEDAQQLQQQIAKVDNLNMISIAWRALKASVYRAFGLIIPNVFPLSKLRHKILEAAKKASRNAIPDLNLNKLQGEDEERETIPQYPNILTENGEEQPATLGAVPRAQIINDRVIDSVMNLENPYGHQFNPQAFIMQHSVSTVQKMHKTNKAILHYMGYTVPNAVADNLNTWGSKIWGQNKAFNSLLSQAPRSIPAVLNAADPNKLRDALENLLFDLNSWTHGLTTDCGFLRALSGLGKADIRILYGIKLLLTYKVQKLDAFLEDVANSGIGFANMILMSLMAKVMTPLQVAYETWLLKWNAAAKGALGATIRRYTPFDSFIDEIYGFMDELGDELVGMINSYVSQLKLSTVTFSKHRQQSARKTKFNALLWLINELIKAIQNAEMCRDTEIGTAQGSNIAELADTDLQPTTNELAGFMNNRGIREGQVSQKIKDNPQLKFSDLNFIPDNASEQIINSINDCIGLSNQELMDLKTRLAKGIVNVNTL